MNKPTLFYFYLMKQFFLCSLFVVLFIKSTSQNLTGTWEAIGNDYKIVIIQIKDSCFGYTYDSGIGYCKANFIGRYNDSTKKLNGINTDFIEKTFAHGLSSYQLKYSQNADGAYLKGKAAPKQAAMKVLSFGLSIPIVYRKVSDQVDTTLFIAAKLAFYNASPVLPGRPVFQDPGTEQYSAGNQLPDTSGIYWQKETRASKLVNTIFTEADSLRLLLFDNGEIDNDTVTVFLNGKIIVNQLGLSVKAFETIIPIDTRDSIHAIELMANNLGSIPPNTAYLVIWAGKEKYELRVASDYTINAKINIVYNGKKR